ncbi:alpha/beta fold hydrolase [Roseovarius aestuarii]|nr:alpha/beta fold hydrolase [Roseovarius aestuarii]
MTMIPITVDSGGGEYMDAVVVLEWKVQPGDRVAVGDVLVEVETAKAVIEVVAEQDGWLASIAFGPDSEAPVGVALGQISDVQDFAAEIPETGAAPSPELRSASVPPTQVSTLRVVASPLARRVARNAGVDLGTLRGSGPNGRIKRADVEAALAQGAANTAPTLTQPAPPQLSNTARVVLIHGFGADRTTWHALRGLLPVSYQVLAPDLPGHGKAPNGQMNRLGDFVSYLADWIADQGLEDCHLVGHSLGGALAIALADSGCVVTRSMTLISPAGLGPDINGGFVQGIARSTTPDTLTQWLSVMVADRKCLPAGLAQGMLRQRANGVRGETLAQMADALFAESTQGFDMRDALARYAGALRVIWGRQDRIIPARHADELPDTAALHLLSDTGHVPHLERPSLIARLIAQTVASGQM